MPKTFDFTLKKPSANMIESPIYYSHFTRLKSFAYDMDFTISLKKNLKYSFYELKSNSSRYYSTGSLFTDDFLFAYKLNKIV